MTALRRRQPEDMQVRFTSSVERGSLLTELASEPPTR